MPGASTPASKLASIQTAANEIKSVAAQLSVGEANLAQTLSDAAAAILQAAQGLAQDAASARQAEVNAEAALAEAQMAAQTATPSGNTASATAPTSTDQTQVYVSAPAAGSMALVGLLVGTAGGYVVKGYLDKRKLKAREEAHLTEGEEDE